MMGLEGAVLIPALILGSVIIIYLGLIGVRRRQLERRENEGSLPSQHAGAGHRAR